VKFGWGKGLLVSYLVFMVVILATVAFSFTMDVNLVSDNYYERELKHQYEIDKLNRYAQLPEKINFVVSADKLKISFPKIFSEEQISGKIIFFRPDDSKKDISVKISTDDSLNHEVPLSAVAKGLWKISVDWQVKNVAYLTIKNLMVN